MCDYLLFNNHTREIMKKNYEEMEHWIVANILKRGLENEDAITLALDLENNEEAADQVMKYLKQAPMTQRPRAVLTEANRIAFKIAKGREI